MFHGCFEDGFIGNSIGGCFGESQDCQSVLVGGACGIMIGGCSKYLRNGV